MREPRDVAHLAGSLALAALFAVLLLAPPAGAQPAPPEPAAEAWILVDARDGEPLAKDDPRDQRAIASATKLMTAYLALREGRLDERIAAPPYTPAAAAESLLGITAGERITYRDLVYSLILASANDGAVAVAEGVSGSVDRFVSRMNATAVRLGLDDTSFANPIGLDDPLNYSSAADLAVLAAILLEDPFFRRVADSEAHTVKTDQATRSIVTRNDLLGQEPWVTGVKTGYTAEAGNVLVGSGERKGVRLVAVVLGAPTESDRDQGVLSLLDYGFSLYRADEPVARREALADPPVDSGGTIELLASRTVEVSVRRDQDVRTDVDAPAELEGPVRRGQRLGSVTVTVDGEEAGSSPLVAARGAPAASLTDQARDNFPTLALVGGALIVIVLAVVIVRRTMREGRGVTR